MDATKFYGSAFLKIGDVKAAGGKISVAIADVQEGRFDKPNLIFDDGTQLSCNATNTRKLAQEYGTETDDWHGKAIDLIVGLIDYQGRPQEAILVVPVSPSIKPPPARRGEMDDEIPF
jgi:hypothetical protein